MSLSLGEKLRQAREDRGLTLSEVSEHTRISPLYLESIENDDYKILPGGIFNKGFVKSYAKFVGINEQEALADYSNILAEAEAKDEEPHRLYKPEVLTDDRSNSSMLPTMIIAGVILAAMTVGILYLVSYLRQPSDPVASNITPKANTNTQTPSNTVAETPATNIPDMATLNVEFKATSQPVKVVSSVDGEPPKSTNVAAGSSISFTPKESLTINYIRWNAPVVQMSINGKAITLPAEPLDPKDRDRIVFTISKDNLAQIWTSGAISTTPPAAAIDANANVNANAATNVAPASTPRQTPAGRPNPTPNPANSTATPVPAPTRNVVVVPSAPNSNRP